MDDGGGGGSHGDSIDNLFSLLSSALGWLYFICWSVSFYPQILNNYRRKSVTGLSIDYVVANFFGFLCYALFNTLMYFSEGAREQYRERNGGKDILVALNDVIFALHATIMALVMIIQFCWYRAPGEDPSTLGTSLAITLSLIILIGAAAVVTLRIDLLDYLYTLSYIKLLLTVVKCIPQAWLNWLRQSTHGFSIANVLLDFFGGLFSIGQLVLDAILSGHFSGITGYVTKLVLGVISVLFDTIFMLQHYVWYPEPSGPHLVAHEEYNPALNGDGQEK